MLGRHTVLRKELFAHRRELVIWTSWGLLTSAVNVVIVWYGGYLNVMGGATIGDIMAFQWYTFLLLNPVWNIVNSFSELQRSLAAMERVFEVLGMENDKPDRPDARDAPRVVARDPLRGRRVRVSRGPAGRARLQRRRARRLGRGAGRPQRRRQDDRDRPGRALPRSDPRAASCSTAPTSATSGSRSYREPAGDRAAGRVPVRRLGARQHRLRPPATPPTPKSRTPRGAPTPTSSSSGCPSKYETFDRRARRQAVGRPAAAAGDRARGPRVAADPHPGRGDEQPRHRERAADPGVDGRRCSPAAPPSSSPTACRRSAAPT